MNRYRIKYNQKTKILWAYSACEAAEKYANLPVFGREKKLVWDMCFEQYDADTRGQNWASYWCGDDRLIAENTEIYLSENISTV